MKKRILSFALACMMVISTFIISKPIVHVHAVETETPTYSLPKYFSKVPELDSSGTVDAKGNTGISGNWSVRVYDSMTTMNPLAPTSFTYWTDTTLTFINNKQQYGTMDNRANGKTDAKYFVNPNKGIVPVFVFTAPESGYYYFDEDVSQTIHYTTAGNKEISVNFLVYKNGYAYANLFSAGPDAKSGKVTGYVALEKGDELMFAVERPYNVALGTFSGTDWYKAAVDAGVSGAYVNDIVVKRIADLPDEYAGTVYTANFLNNGKSDVAVIEDGQFKLAGFDLITKKPVEISETKYYENISTNYPNKEREYVAYTAGGKVVWNTRADMGVYSQKNPGAVVFTAPKAGYYALAFDAYQVFSQKADQNFYAAEIYNEKGMLLNRSETYFETINGVATNFTTATTVFLEEGEEAYLVIRCIDKYSHSAGFHTASAVYIGKEGLPTSYDLPMDWNHTGNFDSNGWELAVKDNWRLTSFGDPADISTMRNGASTAKLELTETANSLNSKSPQSYIESPHNRSYASGTIKNGLYDVSAWTGWYIGLTTRWDGNCRPIGAGDNATYMEINPTLPLKAVSTSHPAVVFTAPEDGTYSYSELVTGVVFAYGGKAFSASATVRKNGEVINMFTPSAADPTRTLEGTVALKKGDILAFVFTQNTALRLATTDELPIHLGKTTVTRIGDYAPETVPAGTTYELPMSWYDGLEKDADGWERAIKGNWKVACFINPADPSTIYERPSNISLADATNTSGYGPVPYIESRANRGALGVYDYKTFTSWYISAARRWQGGNVTVGDNVSFMKVSPNGGATGQTWAGAFTSQPTFVFTSPEDGIYSYSSLIIGDIFVDESGNALRGEVTIRKNGRVINAFAPDANDPYRTLTGAVELKKGDLFMISFRVMTGNAIVSQSSVFLIGKTSLTKIGSACNGVEVDYTPIFDGTSLTDISGNVKLWSYDTDTNMLYDTTSKGDVRMELSADGTLWYAYDPLGTSTWDGGGAKSNYIWSGPVNGPINQVGGSQLTANIGSALVFTAPYDGTFTVDADLRSYYTTSNGGCHFDYIMKLGDGTVLASTNTLGQVANHAELLSVTADLKKGEQIIVIKAPNDDSAVYNRSCSGAAEVSIKEVNHVCSADTVKLVDRLEAGCLDGNVEHYACACGLNYSDANATELLDETVLPGTGHDTGDYLADQGKHWKHCETCGEDVEVKAHSWNKGVCDVCDYACQHEWNGDNVCDNCGYDRTVELAVNAYNAAIDNYFFGGTNEINPVGPTVSLDRFKVALPSGSVTGLTYKLFNLRFDNGEVFLRHHFEVKGDIALYDFTLDGEKVNPVYAGADIYYFETKVALGKLHVPGVIAVSKGNESVEFSVSAYSYLAVALEQSGDADVVNTLKALYDANEAIYTESGDRALLEVTVESADIEKYVSDRTYDPAKEDITLILVMGQSNFTKYAGYRWEYSHYHSGKSPNFPESPLVPEKGTVYSFYDDSVALGAFATDLVLNDASDMHYLSDPAKGGSCIGGISPVFGTRWHELTGTKVVFLQVAEGSSSVDEWVPDPQNYVCGCSKEGQAYRYAKSVEAYTKAYASLSENYNVVLSGYIWNQGESDEKDDNPNATVRDDQSYYDAYKSMHESIMSELDLDFGGISVVRSHFSGDTAEGSASYTRARYAQYKLCNDLDDLYMLSTVSETCSIPMMDQGNPIHYSQKVFNVMGVDMADNLYSQLGFGTTNAYDGIKILSKNGVLLTHIGADGEVESGTNVITADTTAGRILIRTSALGRDDTVSYKLTVNGVDCSQYINAFGLIDWAALEAETGFTSLKVVLNVK